MQGQSKNTQKGQAATSVACLWLEGGDDEHGGDGWGNKHIKVVKCDAWTHDGALQEKKQERRKRYTIPKDVTQHCMCTPLPIDEIYMIHK